MLSNYFIKVIISLQMSLQSKESKLAAHQQMKCKLCIYACTNSPAKAINFTARNVFKCILCVNIDKAFQNVCAGTDKGIKQRENHAQRELGKRNNASRDPIAKYLITRGQGLGDRNFDTSTELDEFQDQDDFSDLCIDKYMVHANWSC